MTPMTPVTPVTSMTLSRRRAVLSAAILTGLPLLGPPAPARAEGTDINLKEWTLIDSLSDGFDAPLDSARWHRGLWYPTSGVGAFRDENAEVSDGVLRLWARAEGSGGGAAPATPSGLWNPSSTPPACAATWRSAPGPCPQPPACSPPSGSSPPPSAARTPWPPTRTRRSTSRRPSTSTP